MQALVATPPLLLSGNLKGEPVGVDSEGIDLLRGDQLLRLPLDPAVTGSDEIPYRLQQIILPE